jgi:hypothetical protein
MKKIPLTKKDKQRIVGRRNRKRAKATQSRTCKLLGAKNVGGLGGEDGEHYLCSYEIKDRENFTGNKMLKQAEKNCPSEDKLPVVVVHNTRERRTNDIVLLRLKHWLLLLEVIENLAAEKFKDILELVKEKQNAKIKSG